MDDVLDAAKTQGVRINPNTEREMKKNVTDQQKDDSIKEHSFKTPVFPNEELEEYKSGQGPYKVPFDSAKVANAEGRPVKDEPEEETPITKKKKENQKHVNEDEPEDYSNQGYYADHDEDDWLNLPLDQLDAMAKEGGEFLEKNGWLETGIGFYVHPDVMNEEGKPIYWIDYNAVVPTVYGGKAGEPNEFGDSGNTLKNGEEAHNWVMSQVQSGIKEDDLEEKKKRFSFSPQEYGRGIVTSPAAKRRKAARRGLSIYK